MQKHEIDDIWKSEKWKKAKTMKNFILLKNVYQ